MKIRLLLRTRTIISITIAVDTYLSKSIENDLNNINKKIESFRPILQCLE